MTKPYADRIKPVTNSMLYPGEVFIVAGAPSIGKTRFQLHMLYHLAAGNEGWWGKFPPMRVLYASQRSWVVTCAQLRTVGGITDLPDTFDCFCPADLAKKDKQNFNANPLEYLSYNVINKDDPPKVVVLDTLATYLPHTKEFNFNNYGDLVRGCDDIYYWAQQWKAAVSVLHHTAKQKTDSKHEISTEKVLGSQAIMAVAISSAILEHFTPNDPTYVRAHMMDRLEKVPNVRYFHGDDFREVTLDEIAAFSTTPTEKSAELGTTEMKVLNEVPFSPTDYGDIYQICCSKFSIAKSHTYEILDRLGKKGYVSIAANELTKVKQAYRQHTQ
jgi:hypothetical protein